MKAIIIILIILLCVAVLYLFAIAPRLIHAPSAERFLKQNLYAHRGLHNNQSDAPENSMAAFKKAADSSYGIELDPWGRSQGTIFSNCNLTANMIA